VAAQVLPSDEVKALAREAGFDLCGLARPEPIPPEHLQTWLAEGMAADMDWMAERVAQRLDVRALLPGAQAVLALACNYYRWDPGTEGSPVSRYARGRDYHATLRDRLRALRRGLLARWPEVDSYAAVDTGPVMERVWAVRAGLGYVGRSGCLITPEFGSWVFLAVMILDAPVDRYDEARVPDRCGSCTLCVDSCPTGAIVRDRTVDARLCLSYQTIENAALVPEALRPAFENRVFGCDVCQDVCPLNAAPVLADPRFAPRPLAQLTVQELAALTPEAYHALIPGSPLARAKYDGLRRNAAYALGAMKVHQAQDLLRRLAQDPAAPVREAAQWALRELAGHRG
jgi:epoxyqueuosine reductase